ncbi:MULTISPECIES: cupin domain-containing protein [unclassified Burkholderia]|uniref:cupin domain-containing protein n=1 Tax=unclassified Burkholderia TaxID=2613784 RepID=UPI000F58D434|nr:MULTISPECIES: cupin domain-containing protein [unclassified Burkholderia]RQR68689.1 anti-sigma factor [Burkholderia sp. Bp9012]RQR70621.1 anti-sigma factor [Burkholderia sp. Bp9011]RQR83618.1 anti-sigma factor [Burkholderia sp. Bp9010]RQZ39003.1 anti-sigma factor [Burkholderia sp. Bp9099]
MIVNADFSRRVAVGADEYRWIASPQTGIERVMLDRTGGDQARATSVVRYARGASFPRHAHPGGEEILVLSGVFSEGDRHYPAGWYLRNPPGSSHQPSSTGGAVIFVKLRQMASYESRPTRVDTRAPSSWHRTDRRLVCPLFESDAETVTLHRLATSEPLFRGTAAHGAELFVLAGALATHRRTHVRGAWMRFPAGMTPDLVAGATVYLKTGHLTHAETGA